MMIIGSAIIAMCVVLILIFGDFQNSRHSTNMTKADQIREKDRKGESLTEEEQKFRLNTGPGYKVE